ncbi:MAG: hypothetical protein AUG51_25295 [Acidobacteria bacterium 13_1_20CM_3_53_8]|nr:MAG: hypothetical protein AUG51_25295 [Acidobacteria bacterium 13_1_20CM_3_53_8]
MRAMILAAGYGTRLWPLTADRTKPAIPFLGRPLVGYIAEYLAGQGVSEVMVNLHHRPESVRAALGDGSSFGVKLSYIEEPDILGTSGALDNAREFFKDETFIVINGKIITDIDLQSALRTHIERGALATLVLKENFKRERFSHVETRDGLVTGFGGMPASDNANDDASDFSPKVSANEASNIPLMFTGIHIMEPRIFDYIPRGVASDSVVDVYPRAIANHEKIAAHISPETWYELSTIQRYIEISLKMVAREGKYNVIGKNCAIHATATITESMLWDNVTVEEGATVNRSILGDLVRIAPGASIENCAVVRAELVAGQTPPKKALKGEVRGENFVVPLGR